MMTFLHSRLVLSCTHEKVIVQAVLKYILSEVCFNYMLCMH